MARLRRGACYRTVKRAYTRVSKYRRSSFVKGVPGSKIRKFEMGRTNGEFKYIIELKSRTPIQIRHNALEAARTAGNRHLEKHLGRNNYHYKIKLYPHHVIRHNPMANFAGADRFQSGMKHAFGKALGRAAQVKKDQTILFARVNENGLSTAKDALRRAGNKLPCKWRLEISELKNL